MRTQKASSIMVGGAMLAVERHQIWYPPRIGWVQLNSDGAVTTDLCVVGFARLRWKMVARLCYEFGRSLNPSQSSVLQMEKLVAHRGDRGTKNILLNLRD